jgi:hypothetical protein
MGWGGRQSPPRRWPGSPIGKPRRGMVDRRTATLMYAGRDRRSATRRKVPLTKCAPATPAQSTHGDRSCSGGAPARRAAGGHRGADLSGGRMRRNAVWLELVLLAQALVCWAQALLLDGELRIAEPKTLRDSAVAPGRPRGPPRPPPDHAAAALLALGGRAGGGGHSAAGLAIARLSASRSSCWSPPRASGRGGALAIGPTKGAAHRPPYASRITDLADQHDTPSDASQPLARLADRTHEKPRLVTMPIT